MVSDTRVPTDNAMKRLPIFLLALTALLAVFPVVADRNSERNTRANLAKVEYLYYQAHTQILEGRLTEAVHTLRSAAALDPADVEVEELLARFSLFSNGEGDSASAVTAYEAIKRAYFANPGDRIAAEGLLSIAQQLDDFDTYLKVNRALATLYPDRIDYRVAYAEALGFYGLHGDSLRRDSALAILNDIERATGPDPMLIMRIMWTQGENADTAAIIDRITRYTATAPGDPTVLYATGRLYKVLEMHDSVMKYYDRALALDPGYGPAILERASELMANGDSVAYYEQVYDVLRSPDVEFEDKYEMLRAYTSHLYTDPSRHAEIGRMYDMVEELHPGEPDLHRLHGSYLLAVDSTAGAIEQFGYLVDLDPTHAEDFEILVTLNLQNSDTVGALEAVCSAIPHFPDNLGFTLMASSIYLRADSATKALDVLDAFDISSFENPKALSTFHQSRGDVLYRMQLTDSAYQEYRTALNYNPDNYMAMNNAAYYMACDGVNLDEASRLIVRALTFDPMNPTLLDTYAWVLFKSKDYPAARTQIDLAMQQSRDEEIFEEAEEMVAEAGDTVVEVVEVAEEVSNDYTMSAEMLDHAGDIYFMTGEPEKAVQFWKRALDLNPGDEKIARKVKYKTYFFE